jgi:MurNAc alpha-1-phosphate uridylyltransferase
MRAALILAAGRGERMRPLTDATPKPLLQAGGKRLIERHLEKLAHAGFRHVIINTAHLAEQFPAALGDGARYGVRIRYSYEGAEPLETGGGILHALAMIESPVFVVVNGDIACDFDFATLPERPTGLAHLVLVDNPPHHAHGDFRLHDDGRVSEAPPTHTFAGIGSYRRELFDDWRTVIGATAGAALSPPRFPLAPLLRAAMRRGAVSGVQHRGAWTDVGTPERLARLDDALRGET